MYKLLLFPWVRLSISASAYINPPPSLVGFFVLYKFLPAEEEEGVGESKKRETHAAASL